MSKKPSKPPGLFDDLAWLIAFMAFIVAILIVLDVIPARSWF